MTNLKTIFFIGLSSLSSVISAQERTNKKGSDYKFTVVKNLEATPIQNQNQTSTCWSFSSLSFFESEMMRMGRYNGVNLSEMFVENKVYSRKADKCEEFRYISL